MSVYPKAPLAGATIDRLSWLSGRWTGGEGETRIEEIWSPPDAGIMMGAFRWLNGNEPFFYEFMLLKPGAAGLELHIKHFDANLIGWEEKDASIAFDLVQLEERVAVFYPWAEGSTGWAVYRIARDGRLEFEEVSEKESSDQGLSLRFAPSALARCERNGPSEQEVHG